MPTPMAKGVIIAVSVLAAASIAAYENPQVREWFEKSSQKVAMAFKSLGEDLHDRRRRNMLRGLERVGGDVSLHEDVDDKAGERRKQARQEIMEKRRVMLEKRKRQDSSMHEAGDEMTEQHRCQTKEDIMQRREALQEKNQRGSLTSSRSTSFDSMVDEEGRLRGQEQADGNPWAASSGVDRVQTTGLRSRYEHPHMHESVDAPILLRQLDSDQRQTPTVAAIEPWETQYEQEMRNAWNIDLPTRQEHLPHSHASESLIDLTPTLTPTSDDFPDPDYSIPNLADMPLPGQRSEYFSAAASQASHTLSRQGEQAGGVNLNMPISPAELNPRPFSHPASHPASSGHASLAGSTSHIGHSEAEMTEDDMSDEEYGDGVRTPASAWTEVGSSVSGDDWNDRGHV